MKGRFQPKQIENMIRRYNVTYGKHEKDSSPSIIALIGLIVVCKDCKSMDTVLSTTEIRILWVHVRSGISSSLFGRLTMNSAILVISNTKYL